MKHIKALDTLRAFAVFFVIIQHWGPPIKDLPTPFQEFFLRFFVPDGAFGVYLFFVLSGFLITGILLSARASEPSGKEKLTVVKNFIVRRALRIFPIYYLTVFILYFYFPDIKPNLPYILSYSLNVLCYRQNNFVSIFSHSWTLCIEEQFYLLWPWLILFVNSKYLKYVFITAIAIGIISTTITMGKTDIIEPFLVTDCLDAFGIGSLYAYMRLNGVRLAKFEKVIRYSVPFCLAAYFYWK